MLFAIIDDEYEVCDVLRLYFESRGHRCIVAHDGEQGLAIIRDKQPAAVFLDVAMPKMNGYEVLTRLRDDPATAKLPVLLMTALTRGETRSPEEWAKATGADAFLAKPFEFDQMLHVVEKMTGVKI
ncbi:N/A [soil metagenome]